MGLGTAVIALLPVALLVAMISIFATWGGALVGPAPVPVDALGKLDIERTAFRPGEIVVQVVNSGPSELTVAQIIVNEALWHFTVSPDTTISRLGRATISIPYPWLAGEPQTVKIVTSNGLAFTKDVAIAVPTPEPEPIFFLMFALLGLYVGVIPVFLGLLWFPVMRRLGRGVMDFFLALTAGLLIFLGLDAAHEALELAGRVPGPYRGFSLVGIGLVGAFLALVAIGRRTVGAPSERSEAQRRLALAYLIAVGIGLHNLGEGLAIGAAYALGELALGAFLVIGFMIHNTTEGFGIVAPVARRGAALRHLVGLGLLAGGPTILGTWLGGFTYSDIWATLFLAIGAGAIFQVVFELARLPGREGPGWLAAPANFAGLLTGLLIMYATGVLVA
ncbi:MAG: metal transporter [Chloroflexi bacterium]|nr:metal transporter [Chloroflexota bacterium]